MNNKKKIMLPMILGLLMVITVIGVTYAFFNYTRTGLANAIRVGRIYFNHEEGDSISLQNVFPISSEQAATDTTNAKTLSISVIGDTDYDGGIEYVVTLDSVNNSKNIPITLEVSVDGTGLGNLETGDYYTNRNNYTESKYKIEYNNELENNNHILVGYISPNVNKGNIEGINGTINIKAYVDKEKVLISDTYPEGTVTIDGVEYYNGTPTTNKTVLTTEEWNSITGNNALSFKIKVEAREGIWVRNPNATAIFDTGTVVHSKLYCIINNYQYSNQDYKTRTIEMSSFQRQYVKPDLSQFTDTNIISSNDSENVIYAWYDSQSYDVYWYTDASNIYLNEDSSYMFYYSLFFTGLGLSDINASRVINMSHMFEMCDTPLDFSNISNWDISNVQDMSFTFASVFYNNQSNNANLINNWNVSNVQNFNYMFLIEEGNGNPSNFIYPIFSQKPGVWDNSIDNSLGYPVYKGTYVPY